MTADIERLSILGRPALGRANDRQIGGDHYRLRGSAYMHWDLMADLDAGYFPGQVTKYMDRHAQKNGRQDVEKALHYAQKYDETETALRATGVRRLLPPQEHCDLVEKYCADSGKSDAETAIFRRALLKPNRTSKLVLMISDFLKDTYPPETRPGTPEDGGQHSERPEMAECPDCHGTGQPGGVKGGPELGLCGLCGGSGRVATGD